jgi:hypothetical protein
VLLKILLALSCCAGCFLIGWIPAYAGTTDVNNETNLGLVMARHGVVLGADIFISGLAVRTGVLVDKT